MQEKKSTAEIKDRLKNYTRLLQEIENEEERLELMKLETPGGRLTEAKRARLESELETMLGEEKEQHAALECLVSRLDDPDERAVIRLRYFDQREWDSIVNAIYGARVGLCENPEKFKRRAQKLHGHALLDLAAALGNMENEQKRQQTE